MSMDSTQRTPLVTLIDCTVADEHMFGRCSASVPSIPSLQGRPPLWSENVDEATSSALLQSYGQRQPAFLSELWAQAMRPNCRQIYLETLQTILKSLVLPSRACARFDRYAMMVCFHLQTVVASLDARSCYAEWINSSCQRPPSWLRMLLTGMHPNWLHNLLHDFSAWAADVASISAANEDSSIIYGMWSRSDFYVGKANTCRKKSGGHFAGAPMRLMEHWEG
jgi:hypothetical protein